MSGSVNKVILIGNLGKDPRISRLNSGEQIASFTLATSETWRDKATGERKEKTEWHNVVVYNENIAKVVEQYCKKGTKVYLEGQLQTRKWQDKETNADRYTTEVVLQQFRSELTLLDSRNGGEGRESFGGGGEERPAFGGGGGRGGERRPALAPAGGASRGGGGGASPDLDDDIPF